MLYGLVNNALLRTGLAFLTALVVSLVFGAWLIRFFHKKNVIEDTTQPDHAGLNAIQSQKKNVPTMGGLMILAGIFAGTLLWCDLRSLEIWFGLLVLAILGGAGFLDDYIKLKHKPSRGLTKTQKLVVQFALGALIGCLLLYCGEEQFMDTRIFNIFLPDYTINVGRWVIPWCGFVMAATSNAVNLTDGLDGLAGGLTVIAIIPLAMLGQGFLFRQSYEHLGTFEIPILCLLTAGAVIGFLWYNCHPAQIFMGDTGSLAIGGLLAYVALALRAELLLLVVGGVFFIEEATVAMQIVSFKLTKKRIFPITPIHHYFQVNLKWPEQKIVFRACMVGFLFALVGWIMMRNW